jgi:hypothetical protein
MMAGHAAHGGAAGHGPGTAGRGMMGTAMTGMPDLASTDPQVLEMRGEMLEAMGEIMLKHARTMRDAGPRTPR